MEGGEAQDKVVIANMRSLINEFKKPYLVEHSTTEDKSDDEVQDGGHMQDVASEMKDTKDHIDTLYRILVEVINANGVIPNTSDMTKKAVYSVFEKNGIFPALRVRPSLKDDLLYFAKLDMRTYPYTLNTHHITVLADKKIQPSNIIIPNEVIE